MLAESPTNVCATADNTMPTASGRVVTVDALRLIGGTKAVLGVGDLSPNFGGDDGTAVIEFGR